MFSCLRFMLVRLICHSEMPVGEFVFVCLTCIQSLAQCVGEAPVPETLDWINSVALMKFNTKTDT